MIEAILPLVVGSYVLIGTFYACEHSTGAGDWTIRFLFWPILVISHFLERGLK